MSPKTLSPANNAPGKSKAKKPKPHFIVPPQELLASTNHILKEAVVRVEDSATAIGVSISAMQVSFDFGDSGERYAISVGVPELPTVRRQSKRKEAKPQTEKSENSLPIEQFIFDVHRKLASAFAKLPAHEKHGLKGFHFGVTTSSTLTALRSYYSSLTYQSEARNVQYTDENGSPYTACEMCCVARYEDGTEYSCNPSGDETDYCAGDCN